MIQTHAVKPALSGHHLLCVQYVVLAPRVKIVILNILPESKRSELKFSLKIAFMFPAVILKWQVLNLNIKKGDRTSGSLIRECGPWSANHVNGTESTCESQ